MTTDHLLRSPQERLPSVLAGLTKAGVPVLLLRAPDSFGRPDRCLPSVTRRQVDLLVPRGRAATARRIFERFDWRFELGGRGLWRAIPKVSYLWDDLVGIDLLWAVPGSPFAVVPARRLERSLWARAEQDASGASLPDPDLLIVYAAVQVSRPGRPQRYDAEDLAAFARGKNLDGALEAARDAGVEASVARGLRVAGIEQRRPPRTFGWASAEFGWRRLRPRRIRGVLFTGTPRLGRAITRSRFARREFLSGYGVFIPRPMSEALVTGAAAAIEDRDHPLVVDVGTGCGAVALAIAATHQGARVHGVDTSRRALWWARVNRPLGLLTRVRFHRGSLLSRLPRRLHGRVAAIAANVPYVPPDLWGGGWTSSRATVVGVGDDGLNLYRSLFRQAPTFLEPEGRLVFQIGRHQWGTFRAELEGLGYRIGDEVSGGLGDLVAWVAWPGEHAR